MRERQATRLLQELGEKEIPTRSVDLWPAVKARIQAEQKQQVGRGNRYSAEYSVQESRSTRLLQDLGEQEVPIGSLNLWPSVKARIHAPKSQLAKVKKYPPKESAYPNSRQLTKPARPGSLLSNLLLLTPIGTVFLITILIWANIRLYSDRQEGLETLFIRINNLSIALSSERCILLLPLIRRECYDHPDYNRMTLETGTVTKASKIRVYKDEPPPFLGRDTLIALNEILASKGLRDELLPFDEVPSPSFDTDSDGLMTSKESGIIPHGHWFEEHSDVLTSGNERNDMNFLASAAYNSDGKTLVSESWDKTIRLWDPVTGQPRGEPLTGHTDGVASLAFSPDGKTLASGSWDKTIRLWDPVTRQPRGVLLIGHTSGVTSLVFSPDGKILASASSDAMIRLWDPVTGQPLGIPLRGHSDGVTSIAFSPDGKRLLSTGLDGTVKEWIIDW